MIIERPMTPEELETSQNRFLNFNYLASTGNVFTSGTIFMLLALALGLSGEFAAALGALPYAAYLFLPAGFLITAKTGACRCKYLCQIVVICGCILLLLSGFIPYGATILFFVGMIPIYLARSASTAIEFPLEKNLYPEKKLTIFLQRTYIFTLCSVVGGTLLVAYMVKGETSPAKISLTLIPGIIFFLLACGILRKVDEPAILKTMAARPILKEVRLTLRDSLMRKQLITGLVINIFQATAVQVNLVAAKEGLHVSDSQVMILTVLNAVCGIGGTVIGRFSCQKIGPRNTLLWIYPLYWFIPAAWLLIPDGSPWYMAAIPFAFSGISTYVNSMGLVMYYMISIPNRLQVGGSFLLFVVTGGFAGIIGLLLNPLFFRFARFFSELNCMTGYHYYYLAVGVFFFFGFLSVLNLPVKYKEYRQKKKIRKLPERNPL